MPFLLYVCLFFSFHTKQNVHKKLSKEYVFFNKNLIVFFQY